ncbi:DMT family transporter [Ktedonosporobacter rubrisoli]|uniref:DMT family transporter n=1 Tax=Ktedonosporobacter rubrisoli TaxID=2509675 RepID=A0A4P6K6D7_KTERU|nr:DMT family transporter [Ktedonosporobacter rubrisoli]QBD83156.1 DMT family transporter [Ktedonosporobacter rubrisoli]
MKLKFIAGLAFLFNAFLFATSYSVSREALGRIEPVVFTFFVMMALVPVALCIIALSWRGITKSVVKSGIVLGTCQCLGLFIIYIALKYNTATSTAFFPSLNGFLAAICLWIFLRQPIARATWLAGAVSFVGALLLITSSSIGGIRGAIIAFLGGLVCTFYVFLADHEQKGKTAYWPLFGIQLLTMAVLANVIVLLFGDWQTFQPQMPRDIWVILYMGLGTICLPTLITVLLQRYIPPITVSFIYILEPVLGAIVANFYLHEVLPLSGYLGGALVVIGAVIHTWGMAEQSQEKHDQTLHRQILRLGRRVRTSQIAMLVYPLLYMGVGAFIVYRLGGFPPQAWSELYHLAPRPLSMCSRAMGWRYFCL